MKHFLSLALTSLTLLAIAPAPALAVDFEYFKGQSCEDLSKELDALSKAEKAINEGVKKKDSEANVKAAVGFLLTGWPFWGSSDHGNANNQLKEVREDIRFVTRAQKSNKCT